MEHLGSLCVRPRDRGRFYWFVYHISLHSGSTMESVPKQRQRAGVHACIQIVITNLLKVVARCITRRRDDGDLLSL